jgi:hypothetical protein
VNSSSFCIRSRAFSASRSRRSDSSSS